MEPSSSGVDEVVVRNLRPSDLDAVIAVDAKLTGRRRDEFYEHKLHQAFHDSGIQVSLAVEADGNLVGFLLARVYYGEFGRTDPVAVLDAMGVHPDFARRGAGRDLLAQLCTNLRGLGLRRLQTEVGWDHLDLLCFFHSQGFRPAPRICLDLDLEAPGGPGLETSAAAGGS
jgi:ribosomal protein S18 acetylase RimI-like enzyme